MKILLALMFLTVHNNPGMTYYLCRGKAQYWCANDKTGMYMCGTLEELRTNRIKTSFADKVYLRNLKYITKEVCGAHRYE